MRPDDKVRAWNEFLASDGWKLFKEWLESRMQRYSHDSLTAKDQHDMAVNAGGYLALREALHVPMNMATWEIRNAVDKQK